MMLNSSLSSLRLRAASTSLNPGDAGMRRELCVLLKFFRQLHKNSTNICCSNTMCPSKRLLSKEQHSRENFHLNDKYAKRYFSQASPATTTLLQGRTDRYKGLWIDIGKLDSVLIDSLSDAQFQDILADSLIQWRQEGLSCIWLTVPIQHSRFISEASKAGFVFHHAEGQESVLYLWMSTGDNKVPRFATHQVGVSGIVFNEETNEALVVKDKNRSHSLWKFPGGLSDLGEDIAVTAQREVFEETGVRSEFKSVLAFRQQHTHPGAFGRSDMYYLCRLKALTFELNPCQEEIEACEWMHIDKLVQEVQASSMTHLVARLMKSGLEHGFETVDMVATPMQSIYKGLTYNIYHKSL